MIGDSYQSILFKDLALIQLRDIFNEYRTAETIFDVGFQSQTPCRDTGLWLSFPIKYFVYVDLFTGKGFRLGTTHPDIVKAQKPIEVWINQTRLLCHQKAREVTTDAPGLHRILKTRKTKGHCGPVISLRQQHTLNALFEKNKGLTNLSASVKIANRKSRCKLKGISSLKQKILLTFRRIKADKRRCIPQQAA
jgi:hypothetical protein